MQHPETKHDCGNITKCDHLAHAVLGDEELGVDLVKREGDISLKISVPSSRYLAVAMIFTDRNGEFRLDGEAYRTVSSPHIVRDWLKDCQENHKECHRYCQTDPEPALSTRVINGTKSASDGRPNPHLMNTNGGHGQYATLSYVWGAMGHDSLHLRRLLRS